MSELQNSPENEQLLKELKLLTESISQMRADINNKKLKHSQKKDDMKKYREQLFSDIDTYYSLLIKKLEEKREKVKEHYMDIEQREK